MLACVMHLPKVLDDIVQGPNYGTESFKRVLTGVVAKKAAAQMAQIVQAEADFRAELTEETPHEEQARASTDLGDADWDRASSEDSSSASSEESEIRMAICARQCVANALQELCAGGS